VRIGVVGGGVLGLTLAYRLVRLGHSVELFESAPQLGGLARTHDYGDFVWDRFYHCILPQDEALLRLLGELGLGGELRWKVTRTGYWSRGELHSMSGNRDFLRFPLLNLPQKARLGAAVFYATRLADPYKLYGVTAADWLTRICGRRAYEVFWRPLLQAKFGPYHDRVAAVFIWATLKRLVGARSSGSNREQLGYVRGGYARILDALARALGRRGAVLHVGAPVEAIEPCRGTDGTPACRVRTSGPGGSTPSVDFDLVVFTAPTALAREVVAPELEPHLARVEREHPSATTYLGALCLVLALPRPLTPYYVLNIGESDVALTGLIEMTNLVDAGAETAGHSLVYVPRYLDSADPAMEAPDAELLRTTFEPGLRRLFPDLALERASYVGIHRARHIQPLPLVRETRPEALPPPAIERPFLVLNTSMLQCATLNNNEVVGLVDDFIEHNRAILTLSGPG